MAERNDESEACDVEGHLFNLLPVGLTYTDNREVGVNTGSIGNEAFRAKDVVTGEIRRIADAGIGNL
jgi:hypothetical protein